MNETAYGRFIRFVAVDIIFYSEKNEGFITGHVSTFFKALVDHLRLNFTLTYMDKKVGTQGEVINEHEGTGLIGALLRNESDVALMPIPMVYENYKYLRFTSTFWITNWRMFSAAPGLKKPDVFQTLRSLDFEVWMGILAALLLFPAAWNLIEKLDPTNDQKGKRGYFVKIFASYSTLVLQARDFSGGLPQRLTYVGWLIASFCLSAAFSGVLLSKLSLPDPPVKLDRLEDTLRYPKLKLITIEKTAVQLSIENSANEDIRRVWEGRAKGNTITIDAEKIVETAMEMTNPGVEKAIILMDHAFLQGLGFYGSSQFLPNAFYMSEQIIFSELSRFAFRKHADPILADKIFQMAMFFFESGIQRRDFDFEAMKGIPCLYYIPKAEESVEETSLNTRAIIFPSIIYALGILASLLLLIREITVSISSIYKCSR